MSRCPRGRRLREAVLAKGRNGHWPSLALATCHLCLSSPRMSNKCASVAGSSTLTGSPTLFKPKMRWELRLSGSSVYPFDLLNPSSYTGLGRPAADLAPSVIATEKPKKKIEQADDLNVQPQMYTQAMDTYRPTVYTVSSVW